MKERIKSQQITERVNTKKEAQRVSLRFNIRMDDNLKIEQSIQTLKKRGWKKEKARLQDLILDELFLKADSKFYEDIINQFTPLEHLFKASIKHPEKRRELEKILKRKIKDKK